MKRTLLPIGVLNLLILSVLAISCKKTDNPIQYQYGTFPDTVLSLDGINSAYDDYNTDIYQLYGDIYLLFSTNRASSGGQFDLEQAEVAFIFDQTSGDFSYLNQISNLPYLEKLKVEANTDGDDFGPYSLFSNVDGYEYLFTAYENADGNLDFHFFRNYPVYGNSIPDVKGPFNATLLNTTADDAYITFDQNQDSVYFSSNTGGNYDIYVKTKPEESSILDWLEGDYSQSQVADSINSDRDERCPVVYKDLMLFASNRQGGMGGYDLYYSIFRKGNWSSPVNLGPNINSAADEFRPRMWIHNDFTNELLLFSSNRTGGEGGFDLYFTGVTFPEE